MDVRDRQALIHILSVLDRALGYPIDNEETSLAKDYLQDVVIRCLEIVGEATKRDSPELRLPHPGVPWRAMAGMRDVLIHAYDQVDPEQAWMAYQRFPEIRRHSDAILNQG
ncbi:DUF86 domain-containing protein [Synechococcus sp. GFB01]|uniref:HepT-like ribonuclease domain-containing protein n=1 Tax=Synechococcus sp. GFB01 TaxID=1662190 RepID=UPI00064FCF31|nr:HepT-like ribonuclease domain-containing protein [Synechococcus sp. GFB01]KMM16818.1 hypothetical protein SYNGFB01_08485 [Synechococcus sp. GFB01]